MEIRGYCIIKKNAKSDNVKNINSFLEKPIRVIEFDFDGGALVINPEASEICLFKKNDIKTKFECSVEGFVITPPNLSQMDRLVYVTKCLTRKGGYNELLKRMVIAASLSKGTFTDSFLWQLQ